MIKVFEFPAISCMYNILFCKHIFDKYISVEP